MMADLINELAQIHPAFALRLEPDELLAMLIRDILRMRVAQIGEVDPFPIDSFEQSISNMAGREQITLSCGPSAYIYAAIANSLGIRTEVVSFLWVADGRLAGHTAAEVRLDNSVFVQDVHPGCVWQTADCVKADAAALAEQLWHPVSEWAFYPSSHGSSASSHLLSGLRYSFGYWGFDLANPPKAVAAVYHDVEENESMLPVKASVFGPEAAVQELVGLTLDRWPELEIEVPNTPLHAAS